MANAPFPPFVKKEATTAPAAPAAPAAETPTVVTATKAPKESKEKRSAAKMMTEEQMRQVLALIKDKSYTEIANELGITKHQVNRVLMDVKKILKAKAESDPEKAAKIEAFIKENLSRPAETRPGVKGAKGGKVKKALNDIVGDILAGL